MVKNNYLRPQQLGQFIIENNCTIRNAAFAFGISKSTVHVDVSHKLKDINYELYKKVKVVLNKNFLERNIRGGLATKNKYKKLKEC